MSIEAYIQPLIPKATVIHQAKEVIEKKHPPDKEIRHFIRSCKTDRLWALGVRHHLNPWFTITDRIIGKRSLSNATDTDSNKRMPRPRKRSAHDALMRTLPDTKDSNLAGPQPFSRSAAASPQPLAKKATVKLCCCDRRGAWVEWRYGKLSDYHDFQSLFEKVAHSYSIQSEHVTGVSFFFADAKRKRAYTVPKGGEAEYQDMIGKIRAVLKDEKHQGSFQVHVEPVVESEDEIEIDW